MFWKQAYRAASVVSPPVQPLTAVTIFVPLQHVFVPGLNVSFAAAQGKVIDIPETVGYLQYVFVNIVPLTFTLVGVNPAQQVLPVPVISAFSPAQVALVAVVDVLQT